MITVPTYLITSITYPRSNTTTWLDDLHPRGVATNPVQTNCSNETNLFSRVHYTFNVRWYKKCYLAIKAFWFLSSQVATMHVSRRQQNQTSFEIENFGVHRTNTRQCLILQVGCISIILWAEVGRDGTTKVQQIVFVRNSLGAATINITTQRTKPDMDSFSFYKTLSVGSRMLLHRMTFNKSIQSICTEQTKNPVK